MARTWMFAAGVVLLCAAPGESQTPAGPSPATTPSSVYEPNDARPGRSSRVPRRWDGQPPLVPHSVRGLTPITRTSNACLRCHGRPGAATGPPPAPRSHFVDVRFAPDDVKASVVHARYVCTACHVTQTNAPPLVGSTFESVPRP